MVWARSKSVSRSLKVLTVRPRSKHIISSKKAVNTVLKKAKKTKIKRMFKASRKRRQSALFNPEMNGGKENVVTSVIRSVVKKKVANRQSNLPTLCVDNLNNMADRVHNEAKERRMTEERKVTDEKLLTEIPKESIHTKKREVLSVGSELPKDPEETWWIRKAHRIM